MADVSLEELEQNRFDEDLSTPDFVGWFKTVLRRNPNAFSFNEVAPKRRGRGKARGEEQEKLPQKAPEKEPQKPSPPAPAGAEKKN